MVVVLDGTVNETVETLRNVVYGPQWGKSPTSPRYRVGVVRELRVTIIQTPGMTIECKDKLKELPTRHTDRFVVVTYYTSEVLTLVVGYPSLRYKIFTGSVV